MCIRDRSYLVQMCADQYLRAAALAAQHAGHVIHFIDMRFIAYGLKLPLHKRGDFRLIA